MRSESSLVLGWKLPALSIEVASTRYRALYPLLALQKGGVSSKVFASGSIINLEGIDALVIVKGFTADDISLAQAAAEKNIPVIYDLCDNIFISGYGKEDALSPVEVVRKIAGLSNAFITPTETLADVVRDQLSEDLAVYVVPDGIETGDLVEAAAEVIKRSREEEIHRSLIKGIFEAQIVRKMVNLLQKESARDIIIKIAKHTYRKILLTRARILRPETGVPPEPVSSKTQDLVALRKQRNSGHLERLGSSSIDHYEPTNNAINARRILWFGNHGANHQGHFGMIDLVDNRAALERIAVELNIELTVVSNNAEKFHQLITPLAVKSRYVEWSPARLRAELARTEIVLMPNSCDAFSICKSANRTALALCANRPVVATPTPALLPLRDCIETVDFYTGIRRYLNDHKHVSEHLEIARKRCKQLYGQETIEKAWRAVVEAVRSEDQKKQTLEPELIVVANLVTDVDLICPITAAAQKCGVTAAIWVSNSMIKRWPYTLAVLSQACESLRVVVETAEGIEVPTFPRSVRAVLTVADTSLPPHKFSNSITQAANKAGIETGTLQHGFENVGLSYSDDLHDIEVIRIDSDYIYVWGDKSLLHPRVKDDTRRKCIPVGCPKIVSPGNIELPSIVPRGKPIIGIFENLHWQRYADSYRSFFLDNALRLAAENPNITFIVKSHNAGRWLTTRFKGELPHTDNLLIADASEPQWRGFTASDILSHMTGVITSPSTVAVDAARAGLPVAVVAHGLELDNYAPLYKINVPAQWAESVERMINDTCRMELIDASQRFAERIILKGDAATRIITHLCKKGLNSPFGAA